MASTSQDSKKTRVIIVRHSERLDHMNPPVWRRGCLPDSCIVLSEQLAHAMADLAGERIAGYNPTRMYCSPWLRCLQTASIINDRTC